MSPLCSTPLRWFCGVKGLVNQAAHLPNGWSKALTGLFLVLVISVGVFFDTWASIIEIWSRSKTYTHGFVIAPISFWLIWSRRHYYLQLPPKISYLAFTVIFIFGFLWLSGDLIHIIVLKQLAVVAMLVSGFWAVLGGPAAYSMSFPLLFLLFMVPMGEELIPFLIEFTTTFTVKLLRLTGLAVYRDGTFFRLTSGSWSVIEACSGISYLIASITLGFVFAYLNYVYYWKRALFMLLSCVVPVIANGFRAYMIVMIGHLSGMTLAVGVDHLIYGGVFFGLVMLLLFYLGAFWRDPPFTPILIVAKTSTHQSNTKMITAIAMILMVFGIWPIVSPWLMDRQGNNSLPVYVSKSEMPGWRSVANPEWMWTPNFQKAVDYKASYFNNGTTTIGIYHAGFGKESQGVELVNSENTLKTTVDLNRMRIVNIDYKDLGLEGLPHFPVDSILIKGVQGTVLAMDWFQIGDQMTNNRYWVKWQQLVKRLTRDTAPELKVVAWIQFSDKDYQLAGHELNDFLIAWTQQHRLSSGL